MADPRILDTDVLVRGANLLFQNDRQPIGGARVLQTGITSWRRRVHESNRMPGPTKLPGHADGPPAPGACATPREDSLDTAVTLDRFLAGVERRAFRIAQMALRDRDDALDVVQGAMFRLARSYGGHPSGEWAALFFRILYNGIRDAQRRRSVRSRIFALLPGSRDGDDDEGDPLERIAGGGPEPDRQLMNDEAMQRLESALGELPARQQEAFVLRCLQGMDVAETAMAMGCSEGSVKTHYFRALQALREKLGEVW
jgi:RNA polymerase sigma-70 factor (ECF subfamily)